MSTEIDVRIEKMQQATRDPVVALHKFNKLRSRYTNRLVFVFEGYEDPIFYSVIADRCGFTEKYLVLVANGKDMVLGLRQLIADSTEAQRGSGVAFFVDHDFDGLKGHPAGSDVYCTSTYSIENFLVSPLVLEKLLYYEFRLQDPEFIADVERNVSAYQQIIDDFTKQIFDVNLLIYFGRKVSITVAAARITEIVDSATKLFSIDRTTLKVTSNCTGEAAKNIVKFSSHVDIRQTDAVVRDFADLDPLLQWRGKFWIELLRVLVDVLREDRNSAAPIHFSEGKGKVKVNLGTDTTFRVLASLCDTPMCVKDFFDSLPGAALR